MIAERLGSPRRDGQELLPQLVAKLIKNSVAGSAIRNFRFPHGDQVYLHGPDGILVVDEGTQSAHVPDGISLWEMKTSADPRSDANDDFSKAEKKLANAFADLDTPVTPDKATFLFVTSKPWEAGDWISEKRKDPKCKWKMIRVLDAVDLAQWIERCPQVMLWFAEQCGIPAEGLYDAEQYLRKLGVGFGVCPLSPELVLAGRDEMAQKLEEQVLHRDTNFTLRGESADEAAAFLAAASLKEPDAYAQTAPLVFADSRADLNLLATLSTELILVPLDTETLSRAKMALDWKPRIIVPDAEAGIPSGNEDRGLTLDQCKRAAVEKHLVEEMKRPEHEAKQTVRDTKGSLIALLWLIGSGPIGVPRWASRKDATTHASLILAGSWLGSNDDDTKVIERLSKKEYRDIETLLQSAELPEGPWIHRDTEWRCVSRDFVWRQLIGKVTETMLKDFQDITQEVLGEQDPALELPRSKRSMAGILGKKRKYSRSLRAGLVDSVARIAIFRSNGQFWADCIVRKLLDPTSPDASTRWLSLADVYSELAEAAPNVFLECLDSRIRLAEAKQFFQNEDSDYDMFAPTSAHVHLLWALERLAWQTDYLSRVLHILAKLAEIEPPAKSGNNPRNSIVTILLPWSPQHAETMQNAAKILKSLYAVSPAVTWNVALSLLPSSHGVQFPTPTLHYRTHRGNRTVTEKEYWEFCRSLVEMMIAWADADAGRWASLIEKYPEVWRGWPELGQSIPDALAKVDADRLTDEDRAVVHKALRKLISDHRQYSDANWAMPVSVLAILEEQERRFLPKDAVLQYSQLFSWHPDVPDAPMKKYGRDWDEWILEKQSQAVKAVYDQGKLADIRRLADLVELPERIGRSLAQMELPETEVAELLRLGLGSLPSDTAHNRFAPCVRAYIWSKFREEGEAWLNKVLACRDVNWNTNAYANLALALPASPLLWDRVQRWGDDVDRLYWSNVGICGDFPKHWPRVLEKWREVKRPWSSLELVARLVDERHQGDEIPKPSVEVVAGILDRALMRDESAEPLRNDGNMLGYYVEHLFLFLDAEKADLQQVAQLEWGWLRVLQDTQRGTKALHSQITSSSGLFVDLLKAVFRGKGEPEETENSEERSKLAEHAYYLLKDIHAVPGYRQISDREEIVNQLDLQKWVEEARRLSLEAGRLGVCDSQIGEILSFAPSSPDGSWPCVEVRNVIENIQSQDLERGLYIGKCNQRGVVFRGKGGSQERELATKYRDLAEKVKAEWPRTASILDDLARGYEAEASRWDEQAKRDEFE
jgi:hypothetical protein